MHQTGDQNQATAYGLVSCFGPSIIVNIKLQSSEHETKQNCASLIPEQCNVATQNEINDFFYLKASAEAKQAQRTKKPTFKSDGRLEMKRISSGEHAIGELAENIENTKISRKNNCETFIMVSSGINNPQASNDKWTAERKRKWMSEKKMRNSTEPK